MANLNQLNDAPENLLREAIENLQKRLDRSGE